MLPRNFGSEKIVHTYIHPFMLKRMQMAHLNNICVKLDIGHPYCCDQLLTAVEKGYRGLRYTAHGNDVVFKSYQLTSRGPK